MSGFDTFVYNTGVIAIGGLLGAALAIAVFLMVCGCKYLQQRKDGRDG